MGSYSQQDAEECWSNLLCETFLDNPLAKDLFTGNMAVT